MDSVDIENAAVLVSSWVIDTTNDDDDQVVIKESCPPESSSSKRTRKSGALVSSPRRTASSQVSVRSGSVGAFAISGLGCQDDEDSMDDNDNEDNNDDAVREDDAASDSDGTHVSPDVLISAELVDDSTVLQALEMKRFKKRHIYLLGCFLVLALVVVAIAVVFGIRLSLKRSQQKSENSTTPTTFPSSSPSMAPTVNYEGRMNDYGFITNFAALVHILTPQECSEEQPHEWRIRIQARCLDGSDGFSENSIIYDYSHADSTSPCFHLDNHVIQCDKTISGDLLVNKFHQGFACGTNSGNATLEFSGELLNETNHCQLAGGMAASITAICESREVITSPVCEANGPNLTAIDERCTFPNEETKPGLRTSLNIQNKTCPALDLESSVMYQYRNVYFSI